MAIRIAEFEEVIIDDTLVLQAGDWCMGFWMRVPDNSGTSVKFLMDDAAGAITLYLMEESSSYGFPGYLFLQLEDTNEEGITLIGNPGALTNGKLLIVQRTGSLIQMWTASLSGSSKIAQTSEAMAAINLTDLEFSGMDIARFFTGNFSLTQEQISALGCGLPVSTLGKALTCHIPFRAADSKDATTGIDLDYSASASVVEDFPDQQLKAMTSGAGIGSGGTGKRAMYLKRRQS